MAERNKTAMYLAVAAGVLLLVAGITGVAMIQTIKDFVTNMFPGNDILNIVFMILLLLAALGGILVIVGGVLIGKNKVGGGKVLITIGVGAGLVGLIIALVISAKQGALVTGSGGIIGFVGIVLSVIARMMAKKDENPQQPQYAQPPAQPGYGQAPQQAPQPSHPQPPQQQYAQTAPQHPQAQPPHQPQPAPAPAPVPQASPKDACPLCGTPMRYISQYSRWYCDICQKYA